MRDRLWLQVAATAAVVIEWSLNLLARWCLEAGELMDTGLLFAAWERVVQMTGTTCHTLAACHLLLAQGQRGSNLLLLCNLQRMMEAQVVVWMTLQRQVSHAGALGVMLGVTTAVISELVACGAVRRACCGRCYGSETT